MLPVSYPKDEIARGMHATECGSSAFCMATADDFSVRSSAAMRVFSEITVVSLGEEVEMRHSEDGREIPEREKTPVADPLPVSLCSKP